MRTRLQGLILDSRRERSLLSYRSAMILTAAVFGLLVALLLPSSYSRVRALLHWNRGIALVVTTPQDCTLVRLNRKITRHYVMSCEEAVRQDGLQSDVLFSVALRLQTPSGHVVERVFASTDIGLGTPPEAGQLVPVIYDPANPTQMGGRLNFDQDVNWAGLLPFCILMFLESAFQALGRSFLGLPSLVKRGEGQRADPGPP
jgi:hypothetical protein